jgi:hypothetical protein
MRVEELILVVKSEPHKLVSLGVYPNGVFANVSEIGMVRMGSVKEIDVRALVVQLKEAGWRGNAAHG